MRKIAGINPTEISKRFVVTLIIFFAVLIITGLIAGCGNDTVTNNNNGNGNQTHNFDGTWTVTIPQLNNSGNGSMTLLTTNLNLSGTITFINEQNNLTGSYTNDSLFINFAAPWTFIGGEQSDFFANLNGIYNTGIDSLSGKCKIIDRNNNDSLWFDYNWYATK